MISAKGRFLRSCSVLVCALVMFSVVLAASPARAATQDAVLEWNKIMNDTVLAGGTSPLVTTRVVALVEGAVFDAVNGIEPRFRPLHVRPNAPRNASQSAAAIQAAYAMLAKLYPAQSTALGTQRDASIAALASTEKANSVAAGVAWGQFVADSIFTWRSTDGFAPAPPPFVGVLGADQFAQVFGTGQSAAAHGVWRPTPLADESKPPSFGAGPQFATMTPWVLTRASQFRLPPPLALDSEGYKADVEETKTMGTFASGSPRTDDQSELALFWAGNTALYWNRIAAQISAERHLSLSENAHLFGLLNVVMADAGIACWDSKYRYVFWRPITAIREGVGTTADTAWKPWLDFFASGTPAHPEYPSGHSTVSGAAAFVLAAAFGEHTAFSVTSDVRPGPPGMPEIRQFAGFSEAVAEIANARVYGGIHFRTSCTRGNALGTAVAEYVSKHAMREGDDDRD